MTLAYTPSNRPVIVKQSTNESGIGSLEARIVWESSPDEEGAIVRLDEDKLLGLYLTFTDAEEFDGAYTSVPITQVDAANLLVALRNLFQVDQPADMHQCRHERLRYDDHGACYCCYCGQRRN